MLIEVTDLCSVFAPQAALVHHSLLVTVKVIIIVFIAIAGDIKALCQSIASATALTYLCYKSRQLIIIINTVGEEITHKYNKQSSFNIQY